MNVSRSREFSFFFFSIKEKKKREARKTMQTSRGYSYHRGRPSTVGRDGLGMSRRPKRFLRSSMKVTGLQRPATSHFQRDALWSWEQLAAGELNVREAMLQQRLQEHHHIDVLHSQSGSEDQELKRNFVLRHSREDEKRRAMLAPFLDGSVRRREEGAILRRNRRRVHRELRIARANLFTPRRPIRPRRHHMDHHEESIVMYDNDDAALPVESSPVTPSIPVTSLSLKHQSTRRLHRKLLHVEEHESIRHHILSKYHGERLQRKREEEEAFSRGKRDNIDEEDKRLIHTLRQREGQGDSASDDDDDDDDDESYPEEGEKGEMKDEVLESMLSTDEDEMKSSERLRVAAERKAAFFKAYRERSKARLIKQDDLSGSFLEVYLDAIDELSLAPEPLILERFIRSSTGSHLDLAYLSLAPPFVSAVCAALERFSGISSLDLSQNRLDWRAAPPLAKLSQLEKLNISGNNLGGKGTKMLTSSVCQLKHLDLSNNRIGNVGARALAECEGLESLHIGNNSISNSIEGITWETLKTVKLGWNNLGDSGCIKIVEAILEVKVHCKILIFPTMVLVLERKKAFVSLSRSVFP